MRALALLAALGLGLGCTGGLPTAQQRPSPEPAAVALARDAAAPDRDGIALARLLPSEAERCTVSLPARLDRGERALAALASQSERLPWTLTPEVLAYARADRGLGTGPRTTVEYVRFAHGARDEMVAALERALARPLLWDHAPGTSDPCAGELTCTPLRARFVDPRTVELRRGEWEAEAGGSACAALLPGHPQAIEVAHRGAAGTGGTVRETTTVLARAAIGGEPGLERTQHKRYVSAQAAAQALAAARRGHDELPALVGMPASSLGTREGARVAQHLFASFEELALAARDQQRAWAAAREGETARPVDELDPRDAAAVRSAYDRALPKLSQAAPEDAAVEAFHVLLERAREHTPADDGLARRLFRLQLSIRRDVRAAHALAEQCARDGVGERAAWELSLRAALAHFDEARLRGELARVHALPAALARRMAAELTRKVAEGRDYERAEWAFASAVQLGGAARRAKRAPIALRLPLAELPRALAYLAQAAHAESDLGVHVLALAPLVEQAGSPGERAAAPWSEPTQGAGRPGRVLAASTWDDPPLRELGLALARSTRDGPLSLVLGFERIGTRARTTLLLVGRREGSELAIEQVSRGLDAIAWERVQRLLLTPLARLSGALYPPDPLELDARDLDESAAVRAAAAREPGISCTSEGTSVRCRGGLADQGAARRALLAVARAMLVQEARSLWSGEAL